MWLSETPAELGTTYRIKHATRMGTAELKTIEHRININTLAHEQAQMLEMNEIGVVRIETARPLVFDAYRENRTTGSFILIHPATNATVAAGLILGSFDEGRSGRAVQFGWRIEDGALVLTVENSKEGFRLTPETKTGTGSELTTVRDVEAIDALHHLLRRLRIDVPDEENIEGSDYTI